LCPKKIILKTDYQNKNLDPLKCILPYQTSIPGYGSGVHKTLRAPATARAAICYFSFLGWRTSEALKQEFERGAVACSADARN